jgi:hypothetical protein
MSHILRKIRELRVVWVVVFGLIIGFNCDFFKERITIEPETSFSNLFFLDSANIVYVKTAYDVRWSHGLFGAALSSTENVQSIIESLNFISKKIDTLLVLPELQIPDGYSEPELSFYFPILLISPVVLKNNECSSYFYNIKTKTFDKYPYRNQLTMSDLPDAAYDVYGNIVNPITGKIQLSLPDTGIRITYYSAKNLTAIYYTQVFDSLRRMHEQFWFGKYDMISNSLHSEKINHSMYYYPKMVNNAEYLLYVGGSVDSTTLELIYRDSLNETFEKNRKVFINYHICGDVCDVNIDREWLLTREDTTMVIKNFKGEVLFGPLVL